MSNDEYHIRSRKGLTSTTEEHNTNGHVHQNGDAKSTISQIKVIQTTGQPLPHSLIHSLTLAWDVLRIWSPTLLLIFGGCCSNVYTLEALIQTSPDSGPLITATQFILTSLITLPYQFSLSAGWRNVYLRPRSIPLQQWIKYTAFFLTINVLNNMAFKYRISVPLHIILRSAGPVSTMLIGKIIGKKTYSIQKVIAVFFLFAGVVCAAISDTYSKSQGDGFIKNFTTIIKQKINLSSSTPSYLDQIPGFALLSLALLLSALMGLFTDEMYSKYGRSKNINSETLFYSHSISLPFFIFRWKNLLQELNHIIFISTSSSSISSSRRSATSSKCISSNDIEDIISNPWTILLLNAITQYICVSGVNKLSTKSSSLTVSIILNIRKLFSLLLSIWLFGNNLPFGVLFGATLVFLGGALYSLPSSQSNSNSIQIGVEDDDGNEKVKKS